MKLGILGTGMIVREFLPWLAGPDCPFTVQALCSTQRSAPVADEMCEQYGLEAIQKYGAFKGSLLALWRILRCNPFSHGGYDPVP